MHLTILVGFPLAMAAQGFHSSNLQALYGWTFHQPGIAEAVPKNVFTFENTASGRWWSSYLFVDAARSWSEADANAKEVYGEWYPSLSFRRFSGEERSKGFVRDVSFTLGPTSIAADSRASPATAMRPLSRSRRPGPCPSPWAPPS